MPATTIKPINMEPAHVLLEMQKTHFWFLGRYRFLYHAFLKVLPLLPKKKLSVLDVGGGYGGWMKYLVAHSPERFEKLVLLDQNKEAMALARLELPKEVETVVDDGSTFQSEKKWDLIFLLDVIEHLEEDSVVLKRAYELLAPGGLLIVTVPALKFFWSDNDERVGHYRRYSKASLDQSVRKMGFRTLRLRYFMFLLSPFYLLSRLKKGKKIETKAEMDIYLEKTHKTPGTPLNDILAAIFSLETPLGWSIPFPWGTSLLGVFLKE